MKEFLKQNRFKLGLLVIVLIFIAGAFYWFEYRPVKIKEKCSADAHFDGINVFDMKAFGGKSRQEYINDYYNDCLMRFGLK